jgi:hypothetical protein
VDVGGSRDSWFDTPDPAIGIGSQALVDPKSNEHPGRIGKTTGDGMLPELASVVVLGGPAPDRGSCADPPLPHALRNGIMQTAFMEGGSMTAIEPPP